MKASIDSQFTIRIFLPEDIELYKAIRLEALQLEAGVFSSNYKLEAGFTDEKWLTRIEGERSACFGLFCGEELVGVTGIVIDWNDDELAHMTQSYIRKQHRGNGLSRMLYDTRLVWAKQHAGLKRLRIGHRQSNLISKTANQHYGFKYIYREATLWPDGSEEDALYYELEL